jgi:hypothetical protein
LSVFVRSPSSPSEEGREGRNQKQAKPLQGGQVCSFPSQVTEQPMTFWQSPDALLQDSNWLHRQRTLTKHEAAWRGAGSRSSDGRAAGAAVDCARVVAPQLGARSGSGSAAGAMEGASWARAKPQQRSPKRARHRELFILENLHEAGRSSSPFFSKVCQASKEETG